MFAVGQKIFAKQNWTVTAAYLEDSAVHPSKIEEYTLVGGRGSQAILMRTVHNDGVTGPWRLIRNTQTMTVDVYTN